MQLLEGLNQAQQEAVTHESGPLLIVAGAGTGKTTVIAKRIAWLIETKKARVDQVVALTFTDKAAAEMEERVDKLLPLGYTDLWISTFHAFCERLLHEHALDIGVPHDFKLLTETEQWLLVRRNLDKFNLNYYRPLGNPTKFIHALIRHFSRAKDEEIYPSDYLKYAEELRLNSDREARGKSKKKKKTVVEEDSVTEAARVEEVANAFHVYQQLLLDENALDFGDLINYALKLFRTRPDVLARYRQQFKYTLVDEFQDTNWAQYELVKLLAAPTNNLTVVGDDDQSIYRFRGASMSNILQFEKDYPEAKRVVLTNNYRSSQNILDLSYRFIQHNNPNRLEAQAESKLVKQLIASTSDVAEIQHLAGKTSEDEFALVVRKIHALKARDPECSWSDFAVLARSNDQANLFDAALERAGIPHQSFTSRGLYTKSVIVDALSYLRLLDNYHESPSMWRVLNFPLWDINPREAIELSHYSAKKSLSLFAALEQAAAIQGVKPETVAKINTILLNITTHTSFARQHKPTELFVKALNDIGYTKWIETMGEERARLEFSYLNQFYQRIKRWEETQSDPRIREFIDVISYEIESGEEGMLAMDPELGPDVVRVMTIHAAKGLEFRYVFIVSMVDRRFPTAQRKEPIEMPVALIKEIVPEGNIHLEEERRLFYVAMTRAKRGLFLTTAEDYGGVRKKKPSLFLTELDMPLSEPASLVGGSPLTPAPELQSDHDVHDFIPSKFSFTQIKAFETCPFQYRFAHVLKVPVWGRHTFSFGTSIHLALERFFGRILEARKMKQATLFEETNEQVVMPTLEDLLHIYEESWIDEWYATPAEQADYYDKGKRILKDFFAKHDGAWPETKYLEQGFTLRVGPYTMIGKVDRMDTKDGGVEIIDYKTGNVPADISEVDKDQLLIYQMAAELIWNEKPVALTFYYLNENKPMSFLGTPKELEAVQQKIIKTISQIEKGEFPPTPGPWCKFCDFKDICEFRQL